MGSRGLWQATDLAPLLEETRDRVVRTAGPSPCRADSGAVVLADVYDRDLTPVTGVGVVTGGER